MWSDRIPNGQLFLLFLFFFLGTDGVAAKAPPGAEVYAAHCAVCHEAVGAARVPPQSTLRQLSAARITAALTSGVMRQQGAGLSSQQIKDVSDWLGAPVQESTTVNTCPGDASPSKQKTLGWTTWGVTPENWRYQKEGTLPPKAVEHLELKWAYGASGVKFMRSQPVVSEGRVYLGTDDGKVSALDAKTGCTFWSSKVRNVRSGLVIGRASQEEALFFGDVTGVVHALDLRSGKELWQSKIADHPVAFITGAPTYYEGRLYVPLASYEEVSVIAPNYPCCTFRGSLSSLDAATGKTLWQTHTITESPAVHGKTKDGSDTMGPSGAAIWSSPTIDTKKGIVYVTTGDNYSDPPSETSDAVLALDLASGKILWSRQFTRPDVYNLACGKPGEGACGPDFDFGAPPMLLSLPSGQRALLLGQKSGMVYAVDPDEQGKLLWQQRAGRGGALGGIEWGLATDGETLFVALSDIAFKQPASPGMLVADSKIGGGLAAYRVDSGHLRWKAASPDCGERQACSPAQSAPVSVMPGVVFSGSLDGHVRAYSATDGKVMWDFDTERSFDTVNHVAAEGGSIDVAGPVIADGMVFVSSGYSQYGGKGGNVLLAFGPG